MLTVVDTFAHSIGDAVNLLAIFDALNNEKQSPHIEVLKRAGLIIAMTAWETYVEDRLLEASKERLSQVNDPSIVSFMESKLASEIKRLHNPNSQKTIALFRDYAGIDLAKSWHWNDYDLKRVKDTLDEFMTVRGEVVHRSRPVSRGTPTAHPVTKAYLQKAIRFLRRLVDVTERAILKNKTG